MEETDASSGNETNVKTTFEHDRVIVMLEKAGCLEQHYKVQDCMVEHQDWRKCQHDLKDLQSCIQAYHRILHSSSKAT